MLGAVIGRYKVQYKAPLPPSVQVYCALESVIAFQIPLLAQDGLTPTTSIICPPPISTCRTTLSAEYPAARALALTRATVLMIAPAPLCKLARRASEERSTALGNAVAASIPK